MKSTKKYFSYIVAIILTVIGIILLISIKEIESRNIKMLVVLNSVILFSIAAFTAFKKK
jgi:hypothetical protein